MMTNHNRRHHHVKFEQHDPEITLAVINMLKKRRKEIGLSQAMLGVLTGLDSGHIGKIETFKRKEMSIETFFKLLNGLNIELRLVKKEKLREEERW